MARYGWRPVFIAIGLVSLLWVVPWLRYRPKNTITGCRVTAAATTLDIFRQRNFWAAFLGHFCNNFPLYCMNVWLPLYLVRERHQSMQQMAGEAALSYLIAAIVAPLAGWAADAYIRAGADITLVRKGCMALGMCLVGVGVLAFGAADARLSFAGLMVMGSGYGFASPNISLFAQTLAGPSMAGKWTGLQTCIGNLAGVVVGPLTGWMVDRTGHFGSVFSICAAVSACSVIFWVLLVGRLEQTAWRLEPDKAQVAGQVA
jgi:MFS family permease